MELGPDSQKKKGGGERIIAFRSLLSVKKPGVACTNRLKGHHQGEIIRGVPWKGKNDRRGEVWKLHCRSNTHIDHISSPSSASKYSRGT